MWLCLKSQQVSVAGWGGEMGERLKERSSLLITNRDSFLERPIALAWAVLGLNCPGEALTILIISSVKTVSSEPTLRMDIHVIRSVAFQSVKTPQKNTLTGSIS